MATITFQVNLETVGYPTGWDQPSRTSLDGNETVTEASNFKNTRTLYLPNLLLSNYEGGGPPGSVSTAVPSGTHAQTGTLHPGYFKHGDQFTVSGLQAIYLKKTYVSNPALPTDVLQIVSQS